MKNSEKILIIESIFIVGALVYLFFSTAPRQIYPLQGMSILEPNFDFKIQNGDSILISRDKNFSYYNQLKVGSSITLIPGVYYWKVKNNLRESEVYNFTIPSEVVLKLRKRNKTYELENSGNVDLNVSKNNGTLIKNFILHVGDSKIFIKDNSTYQGEER